jgi:prepilin peptidase CpaA
MIFAIIFSLILFELLVVAWIDFKTKKIWNKWIYGNLIAAMTFHLFFRSLYPLHWETLLYPVGFILIGFLLFLVNVMGAGDSKFLASLFLIIPLEFHHLFFSKLVLSTIVTGSLLLIYRIVKNGPELKAYLATGHWEGIKLTIRSRFSYAPVILLAWVMTGLDLWR